MRELRAEAVKKCELVVSAVATLADRLQGVRDNAEETRKRLIEGQSAGNCPLPSPADAAHAMRQIDTLCARLDVLVMLAFDAEDA